MFVGRVMKTKRDAFHVQRGGCCNGGVVHVAADGGIAVVEVSRMKKRRILGRLLNGEWGTCATAKRDGGAWSLKKMKSRTALPPVVVARGDRNGCVDVHKKPRVQRYVDNAVANVVVAVAADDGADSGDGTLILWESAVEFVCPCGGVGGCGEHLPSGKREQHGRTVESDDGTKERMVQGTIYVRTTNDDDVAAVVVEGGIDDDAERVGSSRGQRRSRTWWRVRKVTDDQESKDAKTRGKEGKEREETNERAESVGEGKRVFMVLQCKQGEKKTSRVKGR